MTLIIFDTSAEVLPKLVLIGYAQSGKCNERQASNYADSSAFIRSDNQVVKSMILGGCRINHDNKTCTRLSFLILNRCKSRVSSKINFLRRQRSEDRKLSGVLSICYSNSRESTTISLPRRGDSRIEKRIPRCARTQRGISCFLNAIESGLDYGPLFFQNVNFR